MADALSQTTAIGGEALIHQTLHGYAEGHRMLASSRTLPDEVSRLLLRMSDLSGPTMVSGFEEYLTGYPLTPIGAYAFAKTWYAPEMPRPGCVWTHTLILPAAAMAALPSLSFLLGEFRRPGPPTEVVPYSQALSINDVRQQKVSGTAREAEMQVLMRAIYGSSEQPVVLSANNASEFESALLLLWSQQWPGLRAKFSYCTAALASRAVNQRPIAVQCVPRSLVREVLRETGLSRHALSRHDDKASLPTWIVPAATDALVAAGSGSFRRFLWSVADEVSGRECFEHYAAVWQVLMQHGGAQALPSLVGEVARRFAEVSSGTRLKLALFGSPTTRNHLIAVDEDEILVALASSVADEAFDPELLRLEERGRDLWEQAPRAARRLLLELFHTTPTRLGQPILSGLISSLTAVAAEGVAAEQPSLLPELFAASPKIAASPALWSALRHRSQELFNALATHDSLPGGLLHRVVGILIDGGFTSLAEPVLRRWREAAVSAVFAWVSERSTELPEPWRLALSQQPGAILGWLAEQPDVPLRAAMILADVLDPLDPLVRYCDATAWLRAVQNEPEGSEGDLARLYAFALALSLAGVPPNPDELATHAFQRIRNLIAHNRLNDRDWQLLEPWLPDLGRRHNWDKCERLQRGLLQAFLHQDWPFEKLLRCSRDRDTLRALLHSARAVDGGRDLLKRLARLARDRRADLSDEQRRALR